MGPDTATFSSSRYYNNNIDDVLSKRSCTNLWLKPFKFIYLFLELTKPPHFGVPFFSPRTALESYIEATIKNLSERKNKPTSEPCNFFNSFKSLVFLKISYMIFTTVSFIMQMKRLK